MFMGVLWIEGSSWAKGGPPRGSTFLLHHLELSAPVTPLTKPSIPLSPTEAQRSLSLAPGWPSELGQDETETSASLSGGQARVWQRNRPLKSRTSCLQAPCSLCPPSKCLGEQWVGAFAICRAGRWVRRGSVLALDGANRQGSGPSPRHGCVTAGPEPGKPGSSASCLSRSIPSSSLSTLCPLFPRLPL